VKLTNKRYYFDYNSTSPLANSVKEWLSSGDFFMTNPNSLHSSGKKALKCIRETQTFLFDTFNIGLTHKVFFHSGSTEGINTFIINEMNQGDGEKHLILFETDHSSAYKIKNVTVQYKISLHLKTFVDKDGELKTDELINYIKTLKGKIIINYTWVNNETGIIWPLMNAVRIKQETGAFIHVDATQSVGKMKDWNQLFGELDAYTFSGHKFGSLTGIGFSFYKKDYPIQYLVNGAKGVLHSRPGTPNTMGIYSIYLALLEIIKKYDYEASFEAIKYLEDNLDHLLKNKGVVIGKNSPHRCTNTISLFFNDKKGQDILNIFDMKGVEMGVGSACSSGILGPNRVLMAYGVDENKSNNSIRLSFEPDLNLEKAKNYFTIIKSILTGLV